jgi:hypothetical protein
VTTCLNTDGFVTKLFIVPRVPWRRWIMVLQVLDQDIKFGVLQPFLTNNLELVGSFFVLFLSQGLGFTRFLQIRVYPVL